VGTIFEDSHIPLSKWLLAIHLLCASKKGMSAHQLHRMLGVTYKSTWFMAHRLRYAMSQEPLASKLTGIVEANETYVGPKHVHGKHGRGAGKKVPVVALVERGTGRVRAFPVEPVTAANLGAAMREQVDHRATIMTDELNVYEPIGHSFIAHETVKHGDGEYVRGNVHTNAAEGFFSLLKRGITGVYHHVGKGHLGRYCDEFAFRYEYRKVEDGERARLAVLGAEGKRLTYKQPAGASQN